MKLPVIVGFGGVNSAGRSSGYHAYRRTVIDALTPQDADETYAALHSMMFGSGTESIDAQRKSAILDGTLIRKISPSAFDPMKVNFHVPLSIERSDGMIGIVISKNQSSFVDENPDLAEAAERLPDGRIRLSLPQNGTNENLFMELTRKIEVSVAGSLPEGFNPASLYKSRNHPRGIQLAVYAASDAIYNSGFSVEELREMVAPNFIGVYASSSIGQTDDEGMGGYARAFLEGGKPSARQLPLGMPQMPADFINSYILGNIGYTSANIGACATFLYNLHAAVRDIRSGRRRIAFVGCAEAPVTPHVIRAYWAMSALSDDQKLMHLDKLADPSQVDFRRACRPFSDNCGFVIAESAQFIILFDHELALEKGADIYGSVPEVFIHADGFKNSISRPGIGNTISFARSAAALKTIMGEQSLQQNTVIYAHGTGTPQNRVTESKLISDVAVAFGVKEWPVAAVKCYVGHSTGPASGDQLTNALGIWRYGIIPGISTIDHIAEDVHTERLRFSMKHEQVNPSKVHSVLINSKGFGGNNATGIIISPEKTWEMIRHETTSAQRKNHATKHTHIQAASVENDAKITAGTLLPIYDSSAKVLEDTDVSITRDELTIEGYLPINLEYPPGKGKKRKWFGLT